MAMGRGCVKSFVLMFQPLIRLEQRHRPTVGKDIPAKPVLDPRTGREGGRFNTLRMREGSIVEYSLAEASRSITAGW